MDVVIVGSTGELISILIRFVVLPAEFAALTVKLNVPTTVGVPLINPSELKLSPFGRAPL
jgi:hypothetical protein